MTANPAGSRRQSRGARLLAAAAATALGLFAAAPAALAAPTNDAINLPFNVELNGGPVTINGGTFGATYQAADTYPPDGEPLTPGGPGACSGREMVATTWYRVLGNGGTLSINTSGSNFDTVIAVYAAPTPTLPGALACNDDVGGGNVTSAVSLPSVAGRAYLIQVGGCSGTGCGAVEGNIVLNVTATEPAGPGIITLPPPLPPDNDGDGIPENGQDKCPGVKPTRDENKDGCQDPPRAILSRFGFQAQPLGNRRAVRAVRISRAELTLAPQGARVKVSCSRCRRARGFRSFSFTAKRSGTQRIGRLSGVQLLRGGRLTVVVTSPERLGRKIVVTLGRRGPNANRYSCLAAGSRTRRVTCPAES